MTGKGWINGSDIRSRGYSHIPDEDWNKIFGVKHGNRIRDIPETPPKETDGDRPNDQA